MAKLPEPPLVFEPLPPEPADVAKLAADERRLNLEQRQADTETKLKIHELRLAERDLLVREKANRRSAFRDPVLLGVIAAAIGLLGNFAVVWYTQYQNHSMAVEKENSDKYLAKQKSDSDLILEATKSPDYDTRVNNLKAILTLGLISDPDTVKRLQEGLKSGLIINNSTPPTPPKSAKGFGTEGYGTDGYGGTPENNSSPTSGNSSSNPPALVAQQILSVPPGAYAQTSNPPCVNSILGDVSALGRLITLGNVNSALAPIEPREGTFHVMVFPANRSGLAGLGGDLANAIQSDRPATCAVATLRLKPGTTGVRVDISATDNLGNWQPCSERSGPWLICSIGWSAWSYNVADNVLVATFKNWSGDRSRSARIEVYAKSQ